VVHGLASCYLHAVSAIQVKNVPPELHERLRARAREEGRNLSDYVLDVLARDLTVPSTREWLAGLARDEPQSNLSSEEVVTAIHRGREERDAQVRGAFADRG
jgi:plasmid stability protein